MSLQTSITGLPAPAEVITTADTLPLDHHTPGGSIVTVKATLAQVATLIGGGGGGSSTLAALTDIDFTTAGTGKVLANITSSGKPYSFAVSPTPSTYDAVVMAETGLTHYWKCNDTSGTTLADSVGSTAANIMGTGTILGAYSLLNDGETGCYLSGTAGNFISIPSSTLDTTTNFSLELVVHGTWISPSTRADIILLQGGSYLILYSNYGNTTGVYSNGTFCTAAANLAPGKNYHLAFTYNGTVGKFYIDGLPCFTGTPLASTSGALVSPILIGSDPGSGYESTQVVGKIAFYNVTLTAAQIYNHVKQVK